MENVVKHLQRVILGIITDIDALCQKNSIDYYLVGGSTIGAVRHKGFIPWDDDLDIIMTHANYEKFIKVCNEQLDREKYYFQEGRKDWPLNYSKVRLRHTRIEELEDGGITPENQGIFVDVFKLDHVPDRNFRGKWQYFCAKVWLAYMLSCRTYTSASSKKKWIMRGSKLLRIKCVEHFFQRQAELYNNRETEYYGFFYGRTNWKNAIISCRVYGKPTYVDFESIKLPVQECVHEYLTQTFGDYMKLPPEKERIGLHALNVDFGDY